MQDGKVGNGRKDFDGNRKETPCKGTKTPEKQDATQELIRKGDSLARSMSYTDHQAIVGICWCFSFCNSRLGVVQLVQDWFSLFVCLFASQIKKLCQ